MASMPRQKAFSASASSSSSSSSFTPRWIYDVFLSFRGEDVRKNFIDHLYTALQQKGIYTFKDDERLERGKSISPELLKSIEESRISIIIFSKTYAFSSWCLDELVKIIDCKDMMGQTVLPVFYDVDPSEVRKQRESYGEAFAKHEVAFRDEMEKVKKWRAALVEAANLSGWDLQNTANGHESKCIQEIVGEILIKLGHRVASDVENLVGIESRLQKVYSLLGTGSNDVRFLGIWGMGGIGKTTIARAIFDNISNQFESGSFLHEVREVSKKCGMRHLQEKLLSDILMVRDLRIDDVYDGVNMIKRRLCYKKVLIILDDVDDMNQLDALAGKHDWFGMGSRIIITTRNKHLLVRPEVNRIYKVSVLNDDDAIRLFSWNAFKKSHPTKDFEELSYHVIDNAGGLPLALTVLGSFLYGRDKTQWKSALDRLKEIPENGILEKLEISFNGLKDIEKKIFLDIACFFKGKEKKSVTKILDCFGFYPDIGITVLIEKSLVTISQGMIRMHDLIQEMGWQIVRRKYREEPGKHSRLWLTEDIYHVLEQNTGTEKVEGIWLDLPKPKDVNFNVEAFIKMNKLRLLKIHNACISRGPEYLPNELRWLDWHGYPSKSMPASFQAKKLVGVKMCYSRIVQLWKEKKSLDRLKFINLSHSQKLIKTPDFTEVPNLERLILENCPSLVEVHPSIGVLKRLAFLNLKGCKSLKSLPNDIQLESLEHFILSGCIKLENFPEIREKMEHLLEVYLDGTAIKELPSSIEHLTSLVLINLSSCKNLTRLPISICRLKCLKSLILSGCSNLEKLPEELGNLECLEELHGDETAIKQPPSSIVLLKNLKTLSFRGCKGKSSESRSSLFSSWLLSTKCQQDSMSLALPSVSGLCSLTKLDLSDCNLLDEAIPSDIGRLSYLVELNLGRNNFVNIPAASINRLSRLKILELVGCKRLETLPELPSCIGELYADDCTSLKSLADLSTKYEKLCRVSLINCDQLLESQKSESMADTLWQHLLQGLSAVNDGFSIVVPGRDVPEWFNYQNVGPSISINLPPHWYNKLTAIAFCCVPEFIPIHRSYSFRYLQKIGHIPLRFNFITHGPKEFSIGKSVCSMGTYKNVDSENVCLAYVPFSEFWWIERIDSESGLIVGRNDICHVLSLNDFCQIEVSGDEFLMKNWGMRLVYEDDIKLKDETMTDTL